MDPNDPQRRITDFRNLLRNRLFLFMLTGVFSTGALAWKTSYDLWFFPSQSWKTGIVTTVTTNTGIIQSLDRRITHLEEASKTTEGQYTQLRDDIRELRSLILSNRRDQRQ